MNNIEELDRIIELLFSEIQIEDDLLRSKLKKEFKDQIYSLFFDIILADLPETDKANFYKLLEQNKKDDCKSFIESRPFIKQAINNFWSERFPALMLGYRDKVLFSA